jgi:hypothetical protein
MGEGEFSSAAARASSCWFGVDRVSGDTATTSWKRRAQWHQLRWRSARRYPIGSEPYEGGERAALVGSRLALDLAIKSGANFLAASVIDAVRARLANPERDQMLKETRLWADLLSSMPLCFNLFDNLFGDTLHAGRAICIFVAGCPTRQCERPV